MNKSMKIIIVIAIVFILAGGIFIGAAYAFGERYVDSKLENYSAVFDDTADAKVNQIHIDDMVADVRFLKAGNDETSGITVEAENIVLDNFKCEVNNNIMTISYNPSTVKYGFISLPSFVFDMNTKLPVIKIYICEGKVLDEVNFISNVGNISSEELNTETFIISGGLGNCNIENLTAGNVRIDGGVGDTNISGTINGQTMIEGGLGNLRISGQMNGNIKLNGGVGNVNFDLSGDANDYNIKSNGGVGDIKINSKKANDFINSSESKYNIDINGGLGNITIKIK